MDGPGSIISSLMDNELDKLFYEEDEVPEPEETIEEQKKPTKIKKTKISVNLYRRAFNELQLMDIMPKEINQGETIHIISGGDVNSFSYLKWMLRKQDLEYLVISTWCMAMQDAEEIVKFVNNGQIKDLDIYVGEIFNSRYLDVYTYLNTYLNKGRIATFKNHSKVYAGFGEQPFAITSSANVNTNPRTEQTNIFMDSEAATFYKEYYDGIVSFTEQDQPWSTWNEQTKKRN